MSNFSIIAAGQKFDIGVPVVLWNDISRGLSFYKSGKYLPRKATLDQLQKQINCFVYHHAVSYTAKSTYQGLVASGLSVNFIIDDDNNDGLATIYQCLDIVDIGYSHKPLNDNGPGVEIAYHPTAWNMPNAYSEANIKKYKVQPHKIMEDIVHGQKFKSFAPTDAQIKSCIALAYGMSLAFPNMKMEFPKDADGKVIKTTVSNPEGLLNHYHLTQQKIDCLGFPAEYVEEQVKIWQHLGL